jgi:hypothetical protein
MSNRKFITLDSILPDEYDPLRNRNKNIKIVQSHLDDPCKRDIAKMQHENAVTKVLNPDIQFVTPQSKEMLPLTVWHQLEATPHGRFSDSEPGALAEKYAWKKGSKIPMNHFDMNIDPEITRQQYYPGGKRINLDKRAAKNDRTHNVITQHDHVKSLYPQYPDGTPLYPNSTRYPIPPKTAPATSNAGTVQRYDKPNESKISTAGSSVQANVDKNFKYEKDNTHTIFSKSTVSPSPPAVDADVPKFNRQYDSGSVMESRSDSANASSVENAVFPRKVKWAANVESRADIGRSNTRPIDRWIGNSNNKFGSTTRPFTAPVLNPTH